MYLSIKDLIAVVVGGALGSAARYLQTLSLGSWFEREDYLDTFLVYVVGAFLLGAFLALASQLFSPSPMIRIFVIVGVLGSFTAFSALTQDFFTLLSQGEIFIGALYLFITIFFGIAAFFPGIVPFRILLQ